MSSAVHRRMLKEYHAIQKNSETRPHLELLEPIQENDLLHWQAVLLGTADSAYEGGRFKLDIVIPPTYPIQPPTIRFMTKICHPNVHFQVWKDLWSEGQKKIVGIPLKERNGATISLCYRPTLEDKKKKKKKMRMQRRPQYSITTHDQWNGGDKQQCSNCWGGDALTHGPISVLLGKGKKCCSDFLSAKCQGLFGHIIRLGAVRSWDKNGSREPRQLIDGDDDSFP